MKKYIYRALGLLVTQVTLAQVVYPPAGQSTYIINSGQTISVTDGQSITFGPGTHIKSGAIFSAAITDQTTATDTYSSIGLSDENYIFTRSYQKGMASFNAGSSKEGDVHESITYFDGLGRPIQSIDIKGAPDKEDIIVHMDYDAYGRQDKDWLPYHEPTGTLGSYRGNRAAATRGYYKSNYAAEFNTMSATTANAYSEKEFEASPLNRVLKQAAPGQDWRLGGGHEIQMGYKTNSAFEVYRFQVNTTFANNTYTPSLVHNNIYYDAGELHKTVTKDENWTSGTDHTTEEFKDKQGRVVLKRTYNGAAHDTYYVYDDYGNLTYVLPPKVTTDNVSTTELNELCYQYKYDQRNRLVEKKIPGKGWEYIVYNKLDQPIMTQDANLTLQNQWLFTKYDAFGRVVYTGRDDNTSATRVAAQNAANNATTTYENRRSTPLNLAGTNIYYSNDSYLDSFNKVFTINYYDSYVDTDGLSVPSTVYGQAKATNVKGLATVSKVRVLGTNDWITTITGYDVKGRPIYTASKNNYLGTTDIVESKLDFAGKVLETKTTHTKGSNSPIVTTDFFTYDHQGRLLRQRQTVNGQPQETLADNTYDDLGQLTQKAVGGGLQTVDYGYNVRGWLKSINDPANLGNDLFAFGINYNTIEYNATSVPLYNGNISETIWKTKNDEAGQPSYFIRGYSFGYDALNRIERGYTFTKSGTNTYTHLNYGSYGLNNVEYDKNGNITELIRSGQYGYYYIDNLDYDYDAGNKLLKVTDSGSSSYKAEGFNDGANSATEYTYDANGNMVSDANKGITAISYNHLNLPEQVDIGSGNIQYVYAADGEKLKKTISTGTTAEYANGYVYENKILQFFPHPEGYVSVENGNYSYVYQYKDHLGNVRLSYTDADGNGTIDPTTEIVKESNYYPFGLEHKGYNNVINGTENNYQTYMGKEHQQELGLETYDFGARNYDPALGRWMNIDPLAEQMRRFSPYNFAFNNPIYFIDPDGMAPMSPLDDIYLDRNGKEIFRVENDQPDRTFVVKTTKTTKQLYSGGTRDGNSNPISSKDAKNTEKQIKAGNVEGEHMNNTVQIANADTQQQMLDHVNQDDGKGGVISESNLKSMDSSNFKEFSGNIDENGNVVDKSTGPVTLPMAGTGQAEAGGSFDFHSHPSGQFIDTDGNTRGFTQPTSNRDISGAQGTEYTFGMKSRKVYIYNKTGVIAIIPFKNFGKKK